MNEEKMGELLLDLATSLAEVKTDLKGVKEKQDALSTENKEIKNEVKQISLTLATKEGERAANKTWLASLHPVLAVGISVVLSVLAVLVLLHAPDMMKVFAKVG